jgi:hypothetical protein
MGALRPDVSVGQAADTIAMMTWGTTWLQLTTEFGWTMDASAAWMIDSLVRLLLRDDSAT